ncbi:3-hydroxylacyl-ACP dehydratase [Methylobacillus sp. MM3]|nr:3-hydroxylacyl-ACP dehydratase [Methylobacillus sp. MM3]OAJ71318.1 3-hydroxylacyl-ACP dehydratase [Methylobacillus sp. MM3]
MCLLDGVESWDEENIQCRASSHRAEDNPLRAHGRLGAACGVEYAAQAMAVHGALLAPPDNAAPKAGFLVSVRGVQVHVVRLDDISEDLTVQASRIMSNENNILYQFSVSAADRLLLEGRAAVVINADALLPNAGSMK